MEYYLAFLAGFFGSMHCVGMCGAIVLAYSTQHNSVQKTPLQSIPAHLAYNAGRVLSKTIVGALLGLVGAGLTGIETIAPYFTGAVGFLLVFSGIWMLKILPGTGFSEKLPMQRQTRAFLFRIYTGTYGKLLGSPSTESKFYIGMLTVLLPCGLLYSMFFKAAASGSPLAGATIMFLFGMGIFPALFITGIASSWFGTRLRFIGDKLAAITIILLGIMMATRALGLPLPWMGGGGGHHH
jgi:uncharacterized protein